MLLHRRQRRGCREAKLLQLLHLVLELVLH